MPPRLLPIVLLVAATGLGAHDLALDSLREGRASFYRAKPGRGACALPSSPVWDTLYAAINKLEYRGSQPCGECLMVSNHRDSVVVRVSDRCPGCKPGGLDLSPAAFRRLAPLGAGRIDIRWRPVACPDSVLTISRTRGSSKFWSSLQVGGLPWPVDSLAVASSDTSWIVFRRQRYNSFVARNLPPTPWTLRTVDVRGNIRIDSLVPLEPGRTLRLLPTVSSATDSVPDGPDSTLGPDPLAPVGDQAPRPTPPEGPPPPAR